MLGDKKEDIFEREFLLKIVKDENGESFQLVFDLLSRDSSQFMGMFKELSWQDRKMIYYFFRNGSLFQGQA